jgi:hypothetical protein
MVRSAAPAAADIGNIGNKAARHFSLVPALEACGTGRHYPARSSTAA